MLRFVENVKKKREFREIGDLTIHEIEHAEKTLIKIVQAKFFPSENSFPNMNVITDEEGIKRVKTRITERSDHPEFIYPIILPGECLFTQRLIEYYHRQNCHAGTQILLGILRERFWIPVSLPGDRVNDAAVFEVVGVDLAEPLYVKGGQKSWIVLFTCATYRAVHLELTSSLSTDAFLLLLRRFIARRGRPRVIYDDLVPLSPAMFLVENRNLDVPDIDYRDTVNLRKRVRYRQKLLNDLRHRFRKEYLGLLIQNKNKKGPLSEVRLGEIVLIGDDIKKRMHWPLAKVIRLIPGKDGKIRTVELKTRTGTMLRPIQRVYPLEMQSTETPNDPLNDCTITNPISSISSDNLSDPNDSSNVLA
ncbi:integrase catalytic domain-containing protein [Trichonephila clavipes]|nr:integrase catalytic domain-containing protein [Trichonephila clavipes]